MTEVIARHSDASATAMEPSSAGGGKDRWDIIGCSVVMAARAGDLSFDARPRSSLCLYGPFYLLPRHDTKANGPRMWLLEWRCPALHVHSTLLRGPGGMADDICNDGR